MSDLQVIIPQPDGAALSGAAVAVLEAAKQIVIKSPDMYQMAANELQSIKRRTKELDDQRKKITKPLDDAKKSTMDLFRAPLEFLTQAEEVVKRAMLAYQQEQERIRLDEITRLQAIENTRIAEERAMAEAGVLEREAIEPPKLIKAETPAPKAFGTSVREVWRAEVTDKKALIKYVADNPAWGYLVEPCMAELNGLAKIQKERMAVPGVTANCEKIIAARGGG